MPRREAASGPPRSSRPRAASRISSSVRARRGPRRRRPMVGAYIGASYPLDAIARTVEPSLDAVQILYAVQGSTPYDDRDHGPSVASDDRGPVRGGCAHLRRGSDGAVLDLRLARHLARARRRGAAGLRRRRDEPGVDLVRHRLDLRPPAGADPAAADGALPSG